jgi:hypothetical protein
LANNAAAGPSAAAVRGRFVTAVLAVYARERKRRRHHQRFGGAANGEGSRGRAQLDGARVGLEKRRARARDFKKKRQSHAHT